jgi:glycosyltransferase involved in cell wall biosynthesis
MHIPKIAALFSTFNRGELLREALSSLMRQTLPKEDFEVVVIDDGSSDHTRKVVKSFESILPIRYAYQTNSGLAEGRNNGIRLAKAPIVVFMDDDDVASPRLLEVHLHSHRLYPDLNVGVLGFTDLLPTIADIPLMHFVTRIGGYLFSYSRLADGATLDYTYFWGGRSSCKRDLLIQRGLFDPVFKFGCEDIELGFRLKESGPFKIIYKEAARTTMIRAISLDDFLRRVNRQGQSNYVFWRKHPCDEIEAWTDVRDLEARWRAVEDKVDLLLASARGLDAIANARLKEGLELDQLTISLLHRSYWHAIDAERLRGSYQKMMEERLLVSETHSDVAPIQTLLPKKKGG